MRPEDLQLIGMVLDAARRGEDGEVLVRRGEDAGRIQISGGKITFVDASGAERDVAAAVAAHTGLVEDELGEIFEDCLLEGRDFGGHLLQEGRAGAEAIRAGLLDFFSNSLLRLLSWVAPEYRFEPGEHPATAELAFAFEDVLQAAIDRDVVGSLPHSAMNASTVLDLAEKVAMPLPGEPLDEPAEEPAASPPPAPPRPKPASFGPEREVTVREQLPAGMMVAPEESEEPVESGEAAAPVEVGPEVATVLDGRPLGARQPREAGEPAPAGEATPDALFEEPSGERDLPPPPVAGTGAGETKLRGEPLGENKKTSKLFVWFAIAFVVGIVATLLIYGLATGEETPSAPGEPRPLLADAGSEEQPDESSGPPGAGSEPGAADTHGDAAGQAGASGQPDGQAVGETDETADAAGKEDTTGQPQNASGAADEPGDAVGEEGGSGQPGGAGAEQQETGGPGETAEAREESGQPGEAGDEAGTAEAEGGTEGPDGGEKKPPALQMSGIVAGGPGKGTGTVRLDSRPRRARVFLDGIDTGKRTPALLRRVPAGVEHVILLVRRGRRPATRKVGVRRGKASRAKLVLRRGRLRAAWKEPVRVKVFSRPEGAAILVDGKPIGSKTPAKVALRADRAQKLTLELEGHDKWERTVRAWPAGELSILATLDESKER